MYCTIWDSISYKDKGFSSNFNRPYRFWYPSCFLLSLVPEFFPVVKQPAYETGQWLPSCAEVKNEWSLNYTPHFPSSCAQGQLHLATYIHFF